MHTIEFEMTFCAMDFFGGLQTFFSMCNTAYKGVLKRWFSIVSLTKKLPKD